MPEPSVPEPSMSETPSESFRLPHLDGHTVTARREGQRTIVELRVDGEETPLYEAWTYRSDGVVVYLAEEMVRLRRAALEEARALGALGDGVLYEVWTSDLGRFAVGANRARAVLRCARQAVGPETLRGRNTPGMQLHHSGAFWHAQIPTYTPTGACYKTRRITVRPLHVAQAARVIAAASTDFVIAPMETPHSKASGAWVRPDPIDRYRVVVSRVAYGLHRRPTAQAAAKRWDEHMTAYHGALEREEWSLAEKTEDGWIYDTPPPF